MAQNENQIGVLGAGLIGMSWAGLFSAFGYDTTVYDPVFISFIDNSKTGGCQAGVNTQYHLL